MADHDDQHTRSMDMGEHLRTWRLFTSMIKWNLIGAAILMLGLLLFRTNT
jgi:hypothetical protein